MKIVNSNKEKNLNIAHSEQLNINETSNNNIILIVEASTDEAKDLRQKIDQQNDSHETSNDINETEFKMPTYIDKNINLKNKLAKNLDETNKKSGNSDFDEGDFSKFNENNSKRSNEFLEDEQDNVLFVS